MQSNENGQSSPSFDTVDVQRFGRQPDTTVTDKILSDSKRPFVLHFFVSMVFNANIDFLPSLHALHCFPYYNGQSLCDP